MLYGKVHSDEEIKKDLEDYMKRKVEASMNVKRAEYAVEHAKKVLERAQEDLQHIELGINDAVKELAHREYQRGDKP